MVETEPIQTITKELGMAIFQPIEYPSADEVKGVLTIAATTLAHGAVSRRK
jgi:hypothetical protein